MFNHQLIMFNFLFFGGEKAIESQMKNQGQEPISFDDFSNEIYDMVRPSQYRRIYFDDLISRFYLI